MKRFPFAVFLILVLVACQTATTTPAAPVPTAKAAASQPAKAVPTTAAAATPTPDTSLHSSSTDPNATNLIVVKDQAIMNASLTFDVVSAAQPCYLVLYYDKEKQGKHNFGGIISYIAIPAGRNNGFVFSLSQNLNASVDLQSLGGITVDAKLQTDPSKPNANVNDNGHLVWVTFNILSTKVKPGLFATPTP